MENQNKLPLGGPAWLRAIAANKEELYNFFPPIDREEKLEGLREITGLRDAANRMEKLERALVGLDQRVHSNYDFNADPDKVTLSVSEALS